MLRAADSAAVVCWCWFDLPYQHEVAALGSPLLPCVLLMSRHMPSLYICGLPTYLCICSLQYVGRRLLFHREPGELRPLYEEIEASDFTT